jgi:hypothetical protein
MEGLSVIQAQSGGKSQLAKGISPDAPWHSQQDRSSCQTDGAEGQDF